MLNSPVLVRSLKLSSVDPSQYLDGWPPGNTGCCWLPSFFFFFSRFLFKTSFFFSHPVFKISRVFAPKMVEKSWENTRQTPWNENAGQKVQKVEFSQQHPVFPGGHPSKYWLDSTLLNFSDRTRTGVFNVIWPLAFEGPKMSGFQSLFELLQNPDKAEVTDCDLRALRLVQIVCTLRTFKNVSLGWSKRALASFSDHERQVFAPFPIGDFGIWAPSCHVPSFEAYSGPLNLACQQWKPSVGWFSAWQMSSSQGSRASVEMVDKFSEAYTSIASRPFG